MILSTPYEIDNVLHPLFQAGHAQFPHLELHGFLRQHLTRQAHGGHGMWALGRLVQELLVEFPQVAHCQDGGVGTFFEVDDVLCHVVESDKVMATSVASCLCQQG